MSELSVVISDRNGNLLDVYDTNVTRRIEEATIFSLRDNGRNSQIMSITVDLVEEEED